MRYVIRRDCSHEINDCSDLYVRNHFVENTSTSNWRNRTCYRNLEPLNQTTNEMKEDRVTWRRRTTLHRTKCSFRYATILSRQKQKIDNRTMRATACNERNFLEISVRSNHGFARFSSCNSRFCLASKPATSGFTQRVHRRLCNDLFQRALARE